MTDIWDKVAESLHGEIFATLTGIREDHTFKNVMQSEIERALAACVIVAMRLNLRDDKQVYLGFPGDGTPPDLKGFFLAAQHEIGDYRADFVFGALDKRRLKDCVVIECDGHDWHEKTKEQAARDKARDRFLSTQAGRVLHFTGSEIYRDPVACWRDVMDVLVAMRDQDDEPSE